MTMNMVNIGEAKAQLAEIVRRVEGGETIILARRNVPIAEIRPLSQPKVKLRPVELAPGSAVMHDDFDAPLPPEILGPFLGE